MVFAMKDLGRKFSFVNAAWDLICLVIAHFTFVETKALTHEEIALRFEGATGEVLVGIESDGSIAAAEIDGKAQDSVAAKTQEL
jgi:hypothetical protein